MFRRKGGQTQRMHLLMSSGAIVIDGGARRVGSQLVSDELGGVAVPGREIPTPSYIHRELNRAPTQQDGVHVETVTPQPVEFDSQFLNEDAQQIWDGARNDMDTETDAQRRWERFVLAIALFAAILVALAGMWLFSTSNGEPEETPPSQIAQPTPTARLPRRRRSCPGWAATDHGHQRNAAGAATRCPDTNTRASR